MSNDSNLNNYLPGVSITNYNVNNNNMNAANSGNNTTSNSNNNNVTSLNGVIVAAPSTPEITIENKSQSQLILTINSK